MGDAEGAQASARVEGVTWVAARKQVSHGFEELTTKIKVCIKTPMRHCGLPRWRLLLARARCNVSSSVEVSTQRRVPARARAHALALALAFAFAHAMQNTNLARPNLTYPAILSFFATCPVRQSATAS